MPAVKPKNGVKIVEVEAESAAHEAGLRKGDTLLSIGGHPIRDSLDYMFCRDDEVLETVIVRRGKKHEVLIELDEWEDPGIILDDFAIRSCGNKCIFCFVSQLPKGLRRPLYLKDEDYRMSFLYGNYITLTNLSQSDRKRIVEQRLSPLYISVHSTDPGLRRLMLGNQKAPDVLKELKFFASYRIHMHTQIVLCPGYNDGEDLKRTIKDLCALYPYVESVAVVPVGLTAQHKQGLRPVEKKDAADALAIVETFQRRYRKKYGDPVVYSADELFIKAGRGFPKLTDYGELPQIENGVGMVPLFMNLARRIRPEEPTGPQKRYLTITGKSFYPYLKRFVDKLNRKGYDVTAVGVENNFFGSSVTVTGLLTGRDVLRALSGKTREYDILLLPEVALREGNDMFLDDVCPADIARALKIKTEIIEATPEGLYGRISR